MSNNSFTKQQLEQFQKARKKLDSALAYSNDEKDPRAKVSEKWLRYIDKNSDMQKERYKNYDEQYMKDFKKLIRGKTSYPIEVRQPDGKFKKFKSIAEASEHYNWTALASALHKKNFRDDGEWKPHWFHRKGFYTRKLIKGKARPPLPAHNHASSFKVQLKAPGKDWITYNGCAEASRSTGWGTVGAYTKRYFPSDGSTYTQIYGKFKGWQTRRIII